MALSSAAVPILDATLMHEKRSSIAEKIAPSTNTNTTLPDGVRILAPHEYKEAAACLAEAFKSDNVVRYAIDTPDRLHLSEEERYELHTAGMEYVVYAHILQGLVLTVGENYDCVALWLPPGKNIDDWWTILRSGMWRMNYRLSKEGKIRFFEEFLPLLSHTKAEVLGDRDEKSWYLNYIGTKPSARGKGYARKLIDYVGNLVRFDSSDWERLVSLISIGRC
jgi:ribosomal protein S18 acetylase RimI-like enzyme